MPKARKPKKSPPPARKRPSKRDRSAADRYFTDEVLLAMGKAGTDPAFAYAFKLTGLMPPTKDSEKNWPKDRLREWRSAVREFRKMEERRKTSDSPDPKQWSTQIEAMMSSGFDKKDYERVRALIRAIEPIERSGTMTLRARWEFAAAVLATALSSAYSAGMDPSYRNAGPEAVQALFDATLSIVVQRAQEIYAQGGG